MRQEEERRKKGRSRIHVSRGQLSCVVAGLLLGFLNISIPGLCGLAYLMESGMSSAGVMTVVGLLWLIGGLGISKKWYDLFEHWRLRYC